MLPVLHYQGCTDADSYDYQGKLSKEIAYIMNACTLALKGHN